jgi:hypothetical protein
VYRSFLPEEFTHGIGVSGVRSFMLSVQLVETKGKIWVQAVNQVTEALFEVAVFVAHRHLRVPETLLPTMMAASMDLTAVEPWRAARPGSSLVAELRLRPPDEAPPAGRLLCDTTVRLDDVPCAVFRTHFAFLKPRPRLSFGRPRLLNEDQRQVRPAQVGRSEIPEVVVHSPIVIDEERVEMHVLPHSDNPAFDVDSYRGAGTSMFLEASCQAANLAVAELRGLSVPNCLPSSWSGEILGLMDQRLPVRCSALPGPLTRDGRDRPLVPVQLEFRQGETRVGVASVVVLQDC